MVLLTKLCDFQMLQLAAEIKANLQFGCSPSLAAWQICMHDSNLHFGFPYSERIFRCMRNTVRTSPGRSPCGGSALKAPSSRWAVGSYQGRHYPGTLVLNTVLCIALFLQHILFTIAWNPDKNSSWSLLYTNNLKHNHSLYYFTCFCEISLGNFDMKPLKSSIYITYAVGISIYS